MPVPLCDVVHVGRRVHDVSRFVGMPEPQQVADLVQGHGVHRVFGELQAVGGAAGNIICVHNVVAASAVVGLVGKEGAVIRKTLMPFVYYALLPGCIGYVIVWYGQGGLYSIATAIIALILATVVYLLSTNGNRLEREAEQRSP